MSNEIVMAFAEEIAGLQRKSDVAYYTNKENEYASALLEQVGILKKLAIKMDICEEVYQEAYKIYDFRNSGRAGYILKDGRIVEGEEDCQVERDLTISADRPDVANIPDLNTYGKTDTFALLCKVSSNEQGFMKSTKVCNLPNGCIVQVTTQQRNPDKSYAVAEALTFVPDVNMNLASNPRTFVSISRILGGGGSVGVDWGEANNMGYKWCPYVNMFCSDIEDEEVEMIQSVNPDCAGDCSRCEEVEEINGNGNLL